MKYAYRVVRVIVNALAVCRLLFALSADVCYS
jgi:hypothetical protein